MANPGSIFPYGIHNFNARPPDSSELFSPKVQARIRHRRSGLETDSGKGAQINLRFKNTIPVESSCCRHLRQDGYLLYSFGRRWQRKC